MFRHVKNALLFACVLGLTFPAAATTEVAREDTVIFDTDQPIEETQSYNVLAGNMNRQHGAHQLMWEPLFILNYEAGQIEPWLASDYASNDDATEWTINLNGAVEWSDGEVFNANDVLFTVNAVLENKTLLADDAVRLRSQVLSVEAKSPTQIVFQLKESNPRFILENFAVQFFSSFLIMPEHVWRGKDLQNFTFAEPIGTGPYTLTSTSKGGAVWDRNDKWWGAKSGFMELPEPKRVVYLHSASREERAARIAANEIDAAHDVSLADFTQMAAQNPQIIVWREESPYAWYSPCPWQLDFNTTRAPWDDKTVRSAVSLLIDRQEIVDLVFSGSTIASRTLFLEHGGMFAFVEALEAAGLAVPTLSQATSGLAMLESKGWQKGAGGYLQLDGRTLSGTLHVDASLEHAAAIAKVITGQLQAAGLQVDAKMVGDRASWKQALASGDFEMALTNLACGSVSEPWTSMQRYTNEGLEGRGETASGLNNISRWNTQASKHYAELVDQLGSMKLLDPSTIETMTKAYRLLVDEVPFTPLVQAPALLPYNTTYWVNWPQEYNNFNHPAFWWGSAHSILHTLQKAL